MAKLPSWLQAGRVGRLDLWAHSLRSNHSEVVGCAVTPASETGPPWQSPRTSNAKAERHNQPRGQVSNFLESLRTLIAGSCLPLGLAKHLGEVPEGYFFIAVMVAAKAHVTRTVAHPVRPPSSSSSCWRTFKRSIASLACRLVRILPGLPPRLAM